RVKPASALEDLLLAHGDGFAPPTLVAGERNVVARHLRRLALTVPQREEAVVTRRVVRGMLLPRRPPVARCTSSQRHVHTADRQEPPPVATNAPFLGPNEVA